MRHSMAARSCIGALLLTVLALAGQQVPAEELSGESGAQLYRQFCASCHGRTGEGDGPVAPFFKLLPPDLTHISQRSRGEFPAERIRRIIDGREVVSPHGAREMPVWGLLFAGAADDAAGKPVADAAITRLVEHLRSLQKPALR